MKLSRPVIWVVVFATAAVSGFAGETNTNTATSHRLASGSAARPANWARPLVAPGITNFYQLTTNLYRGAQPTAEGMAHLKAMGIRTVINLRAFHSDQDRVLGTGLKSVRFETKPWHAEEEDVAGFLKAVTDTNNLPAFVHCERGADRTGTMCALYRVVVCGWTKSEAIAEMKAGGFGFNPVWQNLVDFIEKADVEKLKREAGISRMRELKVEAR
jgi:protein tyrosine/serine phosphatase